MTQRDRILQTLRSRGGHGLTQIDFSLPAVCDGGPPITRVAARIEELKDAGYVIAPAGRRDKCVVYTLVREPAAAQPAPQAEPEPKLFEVPRALPGFDDMVGPLSPYDDGKAA